MSHIASCTCAECAARPASAPRPLLKGLEWKPVERFAVARLGDEVVLSGELRDTPAGVNMGTVCGVSTIVLNGASGITALVVLCEDGKTRAVWYDRELGMMAAAVVDVM